MSLSSGRIQAVLRSFVSDEVIQGEVLVVGSIRPQDAFPFFRRQGFDVLRDYFSMPSSFHVWTFGILPCHCPPGLSRRR